MDDWDLLEQFRCARSEQAFGELVRRHAGFVLATCRRRLRDAHLSEDAAQAVFLVLARRPPTRSGSGALVGWLHKTAIYACNNAMRAKMSRDKHERKAAAERSAVVDPRMNPAADHADTERLLDDALAELSSKERDAVLLRYYQEQSVQQVGQSLGISQNTATKRIGRAIERMRGFLANRGLAVTAPGLIETIMQATRTPPPPEFIEQTISIAMGQSVASVFVQQLAQGVNHMFKIAKLKLAAAVVAVVTTGAGGVFAVSQLMAHNTTVSSALVTSNESATNLTARTEKRAGAETPKAALQSLAAAARAADVEQMKALVSITNPPDERLLNAAGEYAGKQKAFFEAVESKFGSPAETRLKGMLQLSMYDVLLKDIETKTDTITERIEGNEAVFAMGGESGDVRVVRDDSGWRLASGSITKDWSREKYTEVFTSVKKGSATLDDLTNGINEGRFAAFPDLARTVRGIMRGE